MGIIWNLLLQHILLGCEKEMFVKTFRCCYFSDANWRCFSTKIMVRFIFSIIILYVNWIFAFPFLLLCYLYISARSIMLFITDISQWCPTFLGIWAIISFFSIAQIARLVCSDCGHCTNPPLFLCNSYTVAIPPNGASLQLEHDRALYVSLR